jgi:hypothetical protein
LTALTPENNYLYRSKIVEPDFNCRPAFILKTIQKIAIILIMQLFCAHQISFAQDTLSVVTTVPVKIKNSKVVQDTLALNKSLKQKFVPDPMRATMLAVAFPGLGQIYTRKYWKLPLVYGGFGALIYSVQFNSKNYISYMKAYQDFTDLIPATDSYLKLIKAEPSTYDPVLYPESYQPADAQYYKDGMLRMVDYYKRYRDLSYIGIAGWYLLSILDANVDASLFNYDISNNLNLTVMPVQLSLPGGYVVAGLNVGLKINF